MSPQSKHVTLPCRTSHLHLYHVRSIGKPPAKLLLSSYIMYLYISKTLDSPQLAAHHHYSYDVERLQHLHPLVMVPGIAPHHLYHLHEPTCPQPRTMFSTVDTSNSRAVNLNCSLNCRNLPPLGLYLTCYLLVVYRTLEIPPLCRLSRRW